MDQTEPLETRIAGTPQTKTRDDGLHCDYCNKELDAKRHFVSRYDGHYCDKDCHYMFTED